MTRTAGSVASRTGLQVDQLSVGFDTSRGYVPVLDRVTVGLTPGTTLGIVGESGSGKTTLARALAGYLPDGGRITGGHVRLDDTDVLGLPSRALRRWRSRNIAFVHQEAGGALDPSMQIGRQLEEVLELQGQPRAVRRAQARDLLTKVALPDPEEIAHRYPHQLSGGQQQRVLIAAALAASPRLLILDEPTTGLDASVEAEILDLIAELRVQLQCSVVLISHDLGLVGALCDDVAVLYAGRKVEQGRATAALSRPRHPYTAALLRSAPEIGVARSRRRLAAIPGSPASLASTGTGCGFAPRCDFATAVCREVLPQLSAVTAGLVRCHHADELPVTTAQTTVASPPEQAQAAPIPAQAPPTLSVSALTRRYGRVVAVDDVSFDIPAGEVLGLVGESGSGKSTLARSIVGLGPNGGSGTVELHGQALDAELRRRPRAVRRRLQMVFQQPDSTLNPTHRVRTVLRRALATLDGAQSVEELAVRAGFDASLLAARSESLSGGQKQRVAIARAFAGTPELVVCDEPVTALDVSVQAGVLELLAQVQESTGVSYLFISHDLAVVSYLANQVAVLYRGQVVELGPTALVLGGPHHPYTAMLVSAARRERAAVTGPPPGRHVGHAGCRFATRCPSYLGEICATQPPPLRLIGDRHTVRCHLPPDDLPFRSDLAAANLAEEAPCPT